MVQKQLPATLQADRRKWGFKNTKALVGTESQNNEVILITFSYSILYSLC
jgi:hypothetical protein